MVENTGDDYEPNYENVAVFSTLKRAFHCMLNKCEKYYPNEYEDLVEKAHKAGFNDLTAYLLANNCWHTNYYFVEGFDLNVEP